MSQQSALQESVRAVTGTNLSFNEDLLTLFNGAGAGGVHWNEAALRYFRGLTGAPGLSEALNRFARNNGAYNWGSLGAADWAAFSADFIEPPLRSDATFTRASAGWSIDEAAKLVENANNEGRWDASTGDRGYLNEESATNEARSPDMSGAVVGEVGVDGNLPTGWAVGFNSANAKVYVREITTQNGFSLIDVEVSGATANGQIDINLSPNNVAPCVNNDWYTFSGYITRKPTPTAGISAIYLAHAYANAGGTAVGSRTGANFVNTIKEGESGSDRLISTLQCNQATSAFVMPQLITVINNAPAANITYRIAAPQMERRRFATSPILGPGGPNTRANDLLNFTSIPWLTQGVGTIFVDASIMHETSATAFAKLFQMNDAGGTNRIEMYYQGSVGDGLIRSAVVSAGTAQNPSTGAAFTNNERFKAALAWDTNDVVFYVDGNQVSTTGLATIPGGLTQLNIMKGTGSTGLANGHMHSWAYWKQRKSNQFLADMTKAQL